MAEPLPSQPELPARLLTEAAQWLARRDRGFNAAEQDEYLQWLRADPQHAAAIARHEATFQRMMRVAGWQPGPSTEPNPDLFAPARPPRQRAVVRVAAWTFAAAAALAMMWTLGTRWRPASGAPSALPELAQQRSYLRVNERQALPDGSVVELKEGSYLALAFTAGERRVRLTGEAYFTVAKDATRPFLVEAGGVTVRAVGTAFNVRLDPDRLDVLVTEGVVEVHTAALAQRAVTSATPTANAASAPVAATAPNSTTSGGLATASERPPRIAARERMTIDLTSAAPTPVITVSEESIREALSWQEPHLQFFETPLAVALAEFNRRNPTKLLLADPALGSIPISGRVRVRDAEGFVRLLGLTLDLTGTKRGAQEIVLAQAK